MNSGKAEVDLAIIFWFYKELDICKNRLELIKKYNPHTKIYGVFGGDPAEAHLFREGLADYLDDFHISPADKSSHYKWIHGDLMLLDWYERRGKNLQWDTVAIVQADMLVFDSIANQFPGLQKGQIFLSGFRDLDSTLENRWKWTRPENQERQDFLAFKKYAKDMYGYDEPPVACLFILELLPREFFKKYSQVPNKELGMLEYKVPIYAKAWNLPFYQKDMGVYWKDLGELNEFPMNAKGGCDISTEYIRRELSKPNGWRIFHSYNKLWP